MNSPERVNCAKGECVSKRSAENKYCMKHQLQVFVDEVVADGKKPCSAHIRGCRKALDLTYTFARCEDCRAKEREKDKKRREEAKEVVLEENERMCNTCCHAQPKDQFVGVSGVETLTCKTCREANKVQDLNRDKEHRNELARKADKTPKRIAVKQKWKEDNYEKVAEYTMNCREHRIEKMGVDEYLKANAEQAKKWRDNNPEKVKQSNIYRNTNMDSQYNVYKRSAALKQLLFGITFDEFRQIVSTPCRYCGIIQDRGFNGIDRKDSNIGYIRENCVSCCTMCNYMKNTLSESAFIGRAEHILTYNGIVDGVLRPELFGDHIGARYSEYKYRATIKKKLDFTITMDEFDMIRSYDCYLCGKQTTDTHTNGVDRYDNSVGYILENCRTCCADCNYMKREFVHTDIMDKLKLIYEYNKDVVYGDITNPNDISPMTRSNKKSPEQIKQDSETKKIQRRIELEARYKSSDYKKAQAKIIAENRKNKE
jgi:hypothetical protein